MVELDAVEVNFLTKHYMAEIVRLHGDRGADALEVLLEIVSKVFDWIEPEVVSGYIVIFKTIEDDAKPPLPGSATPIRDLHTLPQEDFAWLVIQALPGDQLIMWKNTEPDLQSLSESAVVYVYHKKTECFYAKRESREVRKLIPYAASMFCRPTFGDLRSSLEEYRIKMIRYSSCPIFYQGWHNEQRIFFRSGSEYIMRNSLTHFLKARLRGGVEVRPEQVVDDSHPVDIKVTWMSLNRIGLVEIKWLGKSKNGDGKITSTYTDYRAREGAEQLADYLDMNKSQAPIHITRGYLVVIDGRRHNTNEDTVSVTRENGLYYQDREIDYNPKYHEIRPDFEEPIRMFTEPICH